ncbi:unnamed protein product [Arctia plantaginis]|uniref:PRELI/MSF1 domain-containing protein n=1 Tax=Arctia plantaginis TaxID=874455 RepID=A0A8S0Z4F0_ARCPL|nr:unnamed protein product [Arctia plantaginis]
MPIKKKVHPENPEWTCFEQSALLDVKNFFGLENTVEKIAMKQYASNVAKGKELIELFMKEVIQEGITELYPWSHDDPEYNQELRRILSRGKEPLSPRPVLQSKKHTPAGSDEAISLPTTTEIKDIKNKVFKESDSDKPSLPPSIEQNGADLSMPATSSTASRNSVPETKKSKSSWLKNQNAWRKTQKNTSSSRFDSTPARRTRSNHNSSNNSTQHIFEDSTPDSSSISRPCYCEQTMVDLLNRWDNLLMLLVCAMVILIIMSSSAYFKRDRHM